MVTVEERVGPNNAYTGLKDHTVEIAGADLVVLRKVARDEYELAAISLSQKLPIFVLKAGLAKDLDWDDYAISVSKRPHSEYGYLGYDEERDAFGLNESEETR